MRIVHFAQERRGPMLKITAISGTAPAIRLRLEGKLLEPWIPELLAVCEVGPGRSISLDLSAVSYADPSGVQALRTLLEQGVVVSACSGFLAELLRREIRP